MIELSPKTVKFISEHRNDDIRVLALKAKNYPDIDINEAVKQIEQEVLTTWPTEAISHAENVVYRLSGMYEFVVNDAPEQAEDAGPAEPVSAGKCSTVS